MRVHLQPAYVIHSRPYRDSSALLDVFTAEYGRVSVVARGARRQSRKGNTAALLQPFTPLLLSFAGRSELKTLLAAEAVRGRVALHGVQMFSGMYMNELMARLLHRNDAHPALFAAYDHALKTLADSTEVDTVLRQFEIILLEQLGYSVELGMDAANGQPVQAGQSYRFEPGVGVLASAAGRDNPRTLFAGVDLLAMASGDFSGSARPAAKRLLRAALAVHLGETGLRSRELFRAVGSAPRSVGAPLAEDVEPAGEDLD
jgi:DNA repair protein RecO (recombination protein O)